MDLLRAAAAAARAAAARYAADAAEAEASKRQAAAEKRFRDAAEHAARAKEASAKTETAKEGAEEAEARLAEAEASFRDERRGENVGVDDENAEGGNRTDDLDAADARLRVAKVRRAMAEAAIEPEGSEAAANLLAVAELVRVALGVDADDLRGLTE